MLSLFDIKNTFSKAEPSTSPDLALDPGQLTEVMQSFPIGGKIRYFSGDAEEHAMDSIVIAYGINNHLIYTQNDINSQIEGKNHVFLIDDDWRDIIVREVESMCIVIPHLVEDGAQMSYQRKVELLSETYFTRGNDITLVSLNGDRGLPNLKTTVRKRTIMREGYYVHHPVVVLEVDSGSMTMVDQRRENRLKTHVTATISLWQGHDSYDCIVVDFSETYARVTMDENSALGVVLQAGQEIILAIDVSQHSQRFVFKGRVFRIEDDTTVIEFLSIMSGDRFVPLTMIDIFEFKSIMLQQPETE